MIKIPLPSGRGILFFAVYRMLDKIEKEYKKGQVHYGAISLPQYRTESSG